MQIAFDNSYAAFGSPLSLPQSPDPVKAPALIRVNATLARELGIDPAWLESEAGVAAVAGNALPEGAEPVATAYAGHQFGQFNPQLGDGRAVLLGEVVAGDGHRYDLQLKGSGRTPWSRGGDGRSPLGPVLREYIVSEAMAALGVPSTRALAAVTTGEQVIRGGLEPGAILARVASSHLRVGTLQFFAARDDRDSLSRIVRHALERHYPDRADDENPALALLESVIEAQASLIARWQLLGFIHGVMNTDNMLLCGETVDYGPCAFMENFKPETVYSSIDVQGRYAYQNQPGIAHWNLTRLAEALLPLIDDDADAAVEKAKVPIQRFPELFGDAHSAGVARKLGLASLGEEDVALANDLFTALAADKADFTLAFRFLAEQIEPVEVAESIESLFSPGNKLLEWLPRWMQRQAREEAPASERQAVMFAASPAFIARNHLIQRAIEDGEEGDFSLFHRLVERLAEPGRYDPADRELALPATPQEAVLRTFCGT
ncbi:MAG: YdiU family protein [Pseudomonadota bacterium]